MCYTRQNMEKKPRWAKSGKTFYTFVTGVPRQQEKPLFLSLSLSLLPSLSPPLSPSCLIETSAGSGALCGPISLNPWLEIQIGNIAKHFAETKTNSLAKLTSWLYTNAVTYIRAVSVIEVCII